MDRDYITTWLMNFPTCLSLHINNNYLRELQHVHKTIKKHTSWICGYYNTTLTPFRFLKDPYYSVRWVDDHTYGLTLLLHMFNHIEVQGDLSDQNPNEPDQQNRCYPVVPTTSLLLDCRQHSETQHTSRKRGRCRSLRRRHPEWRRARRTRRGVYRWRWWIGVCLSSCNRRIRWQSRAAPYDTRSLRWGSSRCDRHL